MRIQRTIIAFLLLINAAISFAQPCTELGQTPSSAFPVCGSTVFSQSVVPLCGMYDLIVPPCYNFPAPYQDRNPYWYKFTCFSSGTLGFVITPLDLNDDYDWQLFDVTGKNPDDVFTDTSCFVSCNWSGFLGITGATSAGANLNECAGIANIFSSMPTIQQGRDYLLLVSHFTPSQAGYTLEFTGGTAVITDPLPPALESVTVAQCEGRLITLRLNKKMLCSSLATDGSDFILSPSGTIQSVSSASCSNGFDLDSINLVLAGPLAPGNYILSIINGNDGNTLLDNCGTNIPQNDNLGFTILGGPPLPMGTIEPAFCSPSEIVLNFTDSVLCNSIASNGSDFIINGPSSVTISAADYNCDANGFTNSITLQFSSPVVMLGTYQVRVQQGTDGNTLLGKCNRIMNQGLTASFTLSDDPPALLQSATVRECKPIMIGLRLNGIVQCSSIAADGSDFLITGPANPVIQSATGTCGSAFTDSITITLNTGISIGGNYQLQLVQGSDGNTLLNNCDRPSPVGSNAMFSVSDTVSANFNYQIMPGCRPTDVVFTHTIGNPVNSWNWTINGTGAGNLNNCSQVLSGSNVIHLSVSNGRCSDTDSIILDIDDNNILVAIQSPTLICPGDSVYFMNASSGAADNWHWEFGNGEVSDLHTPEGQVYPVTGNDMYYTITLTGSNNTGCIKSKTRAIKVLKTCRIEVPTGFTPNNDGLNDYLYPLNGFNADQLNFKVYNRWGQLVFQTRNWSKKWDGRINGVIQATGVFLWTLDYIEKTTGNKISLKGTSALIR